MKNTVRVEILGREYTLKSDEGEEQVRRIAEYLNGKLKRLSENTKTLSTLNLAILAAMDIANEYFQLLDGQDALSRKVKKIEQKSGRLIEMIDSKIN